MATGRWETEHKGLRGPKGPCSRRPSGFSGWQLVKRYCGEIGGQACEMNLDTEYRELPTGSPWWVQRPPGQAKAVPADDPATAVASSTCGQAGQNTFARLSGIPLCSLHTGGTQRGYSVGRLPSGNFLQASQQGRKQVGSGKNPWDISARAREGSRRVCDMDPESTDPRASCGAFSYYCARQQDHREFRAGSWERSICQEATRPQWTSRLAESSSPTGTHDRQKCEPRFFTPGFSLENLEN